MATFPGDETAIAPVPDIHTAKTFGVLNIVFSLMLLASGFCFGISSMIPPVLGYGAETQTSRIAEQNLQREMDIKALADEEKAAKTDEEKATLKAKRVELEKLPKVQVNLPAIFSHPSMRDPGYLAHFAADFTSGLGLNLLMLISGVGMLYLKGWGRILAIGVAWLKILRLLALAISLTFVIGPLVSRVATELETESLKVSPEVAATNPHSGPDLANLISWGGWNLFIFGSIYPVATIVSLRKPAVREAFRRPRFKD